MMIELAAAKSISDGEAACMEPATGVANFSKSGPEFCLLDSALVS